MADNKTSKVGDNDKQLSKNEDYNPKLDFFSEHFDPLLALRTPNLVVPVTNAKIYDNIHKYKSVVEDNRPEKREKKVEAPKSTQVIERRWLPHQLPVQGKRKIIDKNVFTQMERMVGPLKLLATCKNKRQRIKIWTRRSHDIRGYCLAFVVAFDKHWNLALEDVEEVWTRPKKTKVPAYDSATMNTALQKNLLPPPITILKSTRNTETCSRRVNQLVLRGEHVAYIVVLSEEKHEEII